MCAHEEQRATKRIEEEDDPIGFVAMLFLPSFSSICIPTDRQTDIEHALLTKDEKVEMTFLFGFLLYTFQFVCTSLLAFYLASETLVKIFSTKHAIITYAIFYSIVFPLNGVGFAVTIFVFV